MDFSLTKDQIELCESIENLCKKKLNDGVYEDDEASFFNHVKWKACGEFGIMGLPIAQTYGGLGVDMLTTALAIQSFGYACEDEGLVFSVCAHMCSCAIALMHYGSEQQKNEFLPKLCSGELIGGNGMTEANAGSDVTNLATQVSEHDSHYCITGTKLFVTNAPVADLLLIYAKHPQGMKMVDASAFIIEKNTPGFSIGQLFKKMGLRTSSISEVILDHCIVTPERVVGRVRRGMQVFNHSMMWERIIMSAYHIGAMARQYECTARYAQTRKQFNQPILQFSSVADMLVNMKMRIETARLLLYKTCWSYDCGTCSSADASMVKLLTSESKVKNSLDAVQIFGAYGYMKESHVERQLRDSIAATIYSGTSQIQRKIIADTVEYDHD